MGKPFQKLLIVDVAALGYELLRRHEFDDLAGLAYQPAQTVFPAVTCPVQASFRTAAAPAEHGTVANGLFLRDLGRPMFWEQSARLVAGERIWADLRRRGGKVGMLFWQQSMGEDVDVLLTPAPIHKHHGGMIQDCYCKPAGLYPKLCREVGSSFKLRQYWGPLASYKAGDWIARATRQVLAGEQLDLCLTYLPTLDYDLQRHGPDGPEAAAAMQRLRAQLADLLESAETCGFEVVVFGDYAMSEVTAPAVLPNLTLRSAGLFATRDVRGKAYPDFHAGRAVAVADHEIAHVYVREASDIPAVREALKGEGRILDAREQAELGLRHPASGELVMVAKEGSWLAYPWWQGRRCAPDYASHVDIHNKPGYDPCELFFGWPPPSVSQDASRVRGTHGRVGAGREIAWASTVDFHTPPKTLLELAAAVKAWLDEENV